MIGRRRPSARATAKASNVDRPIAPPPPRKLPLLEDPELSEAAVIVTCAEPERLLSATDTAVIVTVAGDGTLAGAE